MQRLFQYYLTTFRPSWMAFLTKMVYSVKNLTFGKNFKCDGVPRILIDKTAQISFGDDVYLRRNVEVRAHKNANIQIGDQVRIDRSVRILGTNKATLTIGNGVRIGLNTVLNGGDSISIGENVLISGYVYLQTSMHQHQVGTDINRQGYDHKEIKLGKDVWIGTHVTVMPGVKLAAGTVVGSNAVVTKSSTIENLILTGIPAKPTKSREV
jgi:acetyltransferase-like isoleucine patch superfamily enzyme